MKNEWIELDSSKPKEIFQLLADGIEDYEFQMGDSKDNYKNYNLVSFIPYSDYQFYGISCEGNHLKEQFIYCRYRKKQKKSMRELTPRDLWEQGIVAIEIYDTIYHAVFSNNKLFVLLDKVFEEYSKEELVSINAHWTADRKTWHNFKVEECKCKKCNDTGKILGFPKDQECPNCKNLVVTKEDFN